MSPQQRADLRVCMSCEWIYKQSNGFHEGCPSCGQASYGARSVYGNKAYRYTETQQPWLERKMAMYKSHLWDTVISKGLDLSKKTRKSLQKKLFIKKDRL